MSVIQFVHLLHILPLTAKPTRSSITISTPSFTLMIAESDPTEKDAVVNLTMCLIGGLA